MDDFSNKNTISIDEFWQKSGEIIDVRSPAEYAKGHIPSAHTLPLFSDNERAEIGTKYKNEGHETAVKLGYSIAESRIDRLINMAREISEGNSLRIHCARGGLRSRSFASRLGDADVACWILEGGYKSYRKWAIEEIVEPRKFIVVCGLTGTGKTILLEALAEAGEQVLDLEALANHRGSVFGSLGMKPQPTSQQLSNQIAGKLSKFEKERVVWIESESPQIGTCWLPHELVSQMRTAERIEIVGSNKDRIQHLVATYGDSNRNELVEATRRLETRLGGERTKAAIEFIESGEIPMAAQILLDYYDRTYRKHRKKDDSNLKEVEFRNGNIAKAVKELQLLSAELANSYIVKL